MRCAPLTPPSSSAARTAPTSASGPEVRACWKQVRQAALPYPTLELVCVCGVCLRARTRVVLPAWGVGNELLGLRGLLLTWALGVGASRVGLGKHYCVDVLAGLALGVSIAASPYPQVSPQGWLRALLAATFTAEVVYIAASAQRRAAILGWPFLAAIVVLFWVTFPFAA